MTAAAIDLDTIRSRAEAATPGPWTAGEPAGLLHPWEVCISPNRPLVEMDNTEQGCADAEFIANARQDVPVLLAEVDRLQAIVDAVTSLTYSTDGNEIGPDENIPSGELLRMLHDTRPATS